MRRAASAALSALLLGGCAVGPDYQEPQVQTAERFRTGVAPGLSTAEPKYERWWQNFRDPVLDELVSRANAQNLDLRRALLALETSRAQFTIDFAKLLPDIETGLNYNYRRVDANQIGVQNQDALRQGFSNWQWGIATATWELDVWGAVRRQIESGVSRIQAEAAQYQAAVVSVRAEVAKSYVTLRQIQAQRKAFRDLANGYGKLVDAIEKKVRYQAGSKVELAEVQSRRSAAAADADRFDVLFEKEVENIGNLLAEPSDRVHALLAEDRPVPTIEMPISVGVPATLLRRRPDVAAAERNLQAATAEIGVAEANYLPRFFFYGDFTIQTPKFGNLGDWNSNMTYVVSPTMAWNFMGILTGATQAGVKQAKYRAQDALLRYQLASVVAVNEVQRSIASYVASRAARTNYQDAEEKIRSAYDLAFLQYNHGTIDIARLIQYLQASVVARDGLARAEGLTAINCVELYRSLGGGWEMDPPPRPVEGVREFNAHPKANDFLAPSGGKAAGE